MEVKTWQWGGAIGSSYQCHR